MALRDGLAADRVVGLAPMVRLETAAARFGPEVWPRTAGDLLAAGLPVPGLLVHDPEDDETPYEEAVALAGAWPGAQLVPAPGLGHRRLLRHPRVVAAAVAFVAGRDVER
jgi:pimeloyl-ACP methyl ester carboxylesterase